MTIISNSCEIVVGHVLSKPLSEAKTDSFCSASEHTPNVSRADNTCTIGI